VSRVDEARRRLLRDAMAEMSAGGAGVANRIGRAFALMEIAEHEIASRRERSRVPQKVNDAFGILEPGFLAEFQSDHLYRMHCRELISRVERDEDVRPGTAAECVAVLSRGSLDAPLDRDHAFVYERLFLSMFDPGKSPEGRESYPGAGDEIEARLRKKLARDRRVS